MPEKFNTYHEPFVGGGALFFHLQAQGRITKAILSDANERLIRTYIAVRDSVDQVIALVATMPIDRDSYMRIRGETPDGGSDVEMAAWYLWANRCCYNGLYRVNRSGKFNVSYGTPNAPIVDAEALRASSAALQGVEIRHEDFAGCERAETGDFVYFDPPYVPLSATASFVTYTENGFGLNEQARLSAQVRSMKARGVHVLASNSNTPKTRELYADFTLAEVGARRSINCKEERRGRVSELLIS